MHEIIYGYTKSSRFGLYITGGATFNSPERDITAITIPGKNGTLTIDNKRFHNITIQYPAYIRSDYITKTRLIKEWLLDEPGYRRLEDTYNPEVFRMARFKGPINFDTRELNQSGELTFCFDCMPQKFLKEGEQAVEITEETILSNPSPFPSKPKIRVYGTDGTVYVANNKIIITEIDEYVDIDCDSQNAYKSTSNKNGFVKTDFPEIAAGSSGIKFAGNISKVIVWPRWWTI